MHYFGASRPEHKGSGPLGDGQQDGEAGVAGPAVHFNHPLVLLDEALGQREAQSASAFPPRDQWIEDLVADLFRDAGAVVDHLQFQCQLETALGQRDLARHAGAQTDLAATIEGLGGVADDVEDGLDELLAVGGELGQAGIVVAPHAEVGKLGEDQPPHAFEDVAFRMFQEEWMRQRGTGAARRIAIVDDGPEEQFLYPEFVLVRKVLEARGVKAVIADASHLRYEAGRLTFDGDPIDLAVGLSHREAGRASARHLVERGYRRIGYVGHDWNADHRAFVRYEGMRQGLQEAGQGIVAETRLDTPSSVMAGRDALAQLLSGPASVDAGIFANDDMAVGGYMHCLAEGIGIPEKLALFGFNGLDIGQTLPQPPSTIRSHRFLIGKTATERLLGAPERPPLPETIDTGFEIISGATA